MTGGMRLLWNCTSTDKIPAPSTSPSNVKEYNIQDARAPRARLDRRNYAKKGLAAAAAAAAAAGMVVARTLGRFQLGMNSFFVEALVVEFALLRVAEDVQCFP